MRGPTPRVLAPGAVRCRHAGAGRSACVVNGRLRHKGEGAVRRGPPCVVSRFGFSVLHTVTVDELQIAVAETFDVVVEPVDGRTYTVFAEAMDRSGYARGTLAPRKGMEAAVAELRELPLRTMVDMGMAMDGMATRTTDATGRAVMP